MSAAELVVIDKLTDQVQLLDELFSKYVSSVDELKTRPHFLVSTESRLKLYSLFKQAVVGDAPSQGFLQSMNPESVAKHTAWSAIRGMSGERAKMCYIAHFETIRGSV